jgi:hypothetical protein
MCAEETKTEGHTEGQTDFKCQAEDFQKMSEMMSTCCTGESSAPDCSSMMIKMKKQMREKACCGPATAKKETDHETS